MCSTGVDGYENNHSLPGFLVLNCGEAMRDFLAGLAALPLDLRQELDHLLHDVIEALHECSEALKRINELKDRYGQSMAGHHDGWVVREFVHLLGQLAFQVGCELQHIGAWDANDLLWYRFDQMLGHDLVLPKDTLEELWQHCTQEALLAAGH